MTDRELLELAAKAIGEALLEDWEHEWTTGPTYRISNDLWNPLTDGGDALRLAVYLSLFTDFDFAELQNCVSSDEDAYAATRRAIVLAAAEIGKAMP